MSLTVQCSKKHHVIEACKNAVIAPSIRVRDIQKSTDVYTKILGFQATDTLTRKDGRVAHTSVGFDSPLLMLSPVAFVRTKQPKEDLSTNKLGVGVEFCIGKTATRKLDSFFAETKAKGITVVNEPKTEFWGDRIFTVKDPYGYALAFSEHSSDRTPEARLTAFENAHPM
jgi:uncharacterized glyoxalase superfamily protein PhnB